jgi:hypothetical protein
LSLPALSATPTSAVATEAEHAIAPPLSAPPQTAEALSQTPKQGNEHSSAINLAATLTPKFGERLPDGLMDRNAAVAVHVPQAAASTNAAPAPILVANENPVARELVPLVQQQLNGLATQNFVWQGQIWPGQPMSWEISADPESRPSQESDLTSQWQTRLKLDLPALGGIDVSLRLSAGGALAISVSTEKTASETKLRDSAQALRDQLQAAGLTLTQLRVDHG